MLPAAYTYLAAAFLHAARGKNIELREWQHGIVGQENGWTYHAKGVWVSLPSRPRGDQGAEEVAGPSVTLIGSSNYTTRSYGLDLEVGAMVVTSDEELRRKWRREEGVLGEHTRPVTEVELGSEERRASWRVRLAMWIVRAVGGAL